MEIKDDETQTLVDPMDDRTLCECLSKPDMCVCVCVEKGAIIKFKFKLIAQNHHDDDDDAHKQKFTTHIIIIIFPLLYIPSKLINSPGSFPPSYQPASQG